MRFKERIKNCLGKNFINKNLDNINLKKCEEFKRLTQPYTTNTFYSCSKMYS